jgi:hypothetical protein
MGQIVSQIGQAIGLVIAGGLTLVFFVLGWRVAFGNATEYERNRRRAKNIKQTFLGKVPPVFDGTRDARISAGLAVDRKTNQWIEQGRLSDEAVASALRRPQ